MSLCGYHSICDFSHCCSLHGRRKKGREGEGEGEKHESGEREESACYKSRFFCNPSPFSQLIR